MSKVVLRYDGSNSVFKLVSDKLDAFSSIRAKLEKDGINHDVVAESTLNFPTHDSFESAVKVALKMLQDLKESEIASIA